MNKKQKKILIRVIVASVLLILCAVLPTTGYVRFATFMVPYLVIGYDILKKAWKGILNKQVFDENFLMAVATIGAIALGDYQEGTAVMLFYQIGELFQSYAVGKSRRNISALMDIRPDYANIETDGKLEQVDPDEVAVGSVIVVQPGEKVPLDGIIVEGEASLNTSALTGESLPRDVKIGDGIISGCINMNGVLKIRTTKEFGESTVSKILDLVENASSRKSRSEAFISRFAKVYTPSVCGAALVLGIAVPLLRLAFGAAANWTDWIYRALTFLVVSCPCALVISIPLSFFAGIGGASHEGILIKGSNYLEALSDAKYLVFDKTGTLTRATPQVVQVVPFSGCGEQEVLQLAACLEEHFPHSMANAVVRAAKERGISHEEMHSEVEYIVAHGIASRVGGKRVVIGSAHFIFEDEGCTIPAGEQAKFDGLDPQYSHLYLAASGVLVGVICIADPLRPEAAQVLRQLQKLGITQTVMMTGDSDRTARAIAAQVGVDRCFAEVLPEDKAAFVRDAKAEGHTVVMIGDGINDSPALSAADIGIAIHSGAAIAREIADVTIRADSLEELVTLKAIANALQKRVGSNYRFVLSFNSALILLGALGILPPATSAMLHNLSTLGISLRSMTDLLEQKPSL